MQWWCFKFWFYYRLILACLSHINWIIAVYVNCAYFVFWKSYDLLWFWMHFILCICFVPLRSENYLLVWWNLVRKRFTKYPGHSYKEVYIKEYGKKRSATKSECDHHQLEKEIVKDVEAENTMKGEQLNSVMPGSSSQTSSTSANGVLTSTTDVSSDMNSSSESDVKRRRSKSAFSQIMVIGEEENDCMRHIYIGRAIELDEHYEDFHSLFGNKAYADLNKQPIPPPRKKRAGAKMETGAGKRNYPNEQDSTDEGHWYDNFKDSGSNRNTYGKRNITSRITSRSSSGGNTADEESSLGKLLISELQKRLSQSRLSSVYLDASEETLDVLKPDFTNKYDAKTERERLEREKRERKALAKRIRERRRIQLLAAAKNQTKKRILSSSVELLLQLLRMVSSFAVLIGNIRKTFIPASIRYVKPAESEHPIMLIFRCTVFLDVLLFWTSVMWAYCLQWHLCCRLGLLKFWLWTLTLVFIGTIAMVYPMSLVQKQLDPSWCRFLPNSSLARYQPNW